jgi:hypothetical protein
VCSVNDGCIERVTKMLPNLCSLELENCYDITDAGTPRKRLPNYEELNLALTPHQQE